VLGCHAKIPRFARLLKGSGPQLGVPAGRWRIASGALASSLSGVRPRSQPPMSILSFRALAFRA
jgi:hypothetical protein